ncbi:MAG: phosphoglycerate kinase [Candidatus Saccharibacteria bacterium]|nr:phosphoglycerate kinase [Candidatus Saccharibacteria bacterium]
MKTIREADLKDKVVLVRVDYNVPISEGKITDDLRIRASLPTLEFLREAGAKKIILISHLGRPEGVTPEMSLEPIAKRLGEMLPGVSFISEVSGEKVREKVEGLKDGGILVLENLRFYPGEEENSREFIEEIINSVGAEVFVQDGFAVVHRAHASTSAVTDILPTFAGLLVEKEVEELSRVIENPDRPLVMIVGGSKVDDKAPLIEKFLGIADKILVGGKIAADGFMIEDGENIAGNRTKIYVAEDFDTDAEGLKLDVGPVATAKFVEEIMGAGTVIWNGLLGKAEDPAYATASTIMAEVLGEKRDARTVICGGDTTGFVEEVMKEHPNLAYSLISTGGGAALEFLLGKELPGLKKIV